MRFAIRFLRHRGRILSWREVVNQAPRIGDLRIEECLDAELHRYVRTARLFDFDSAVYSGKLPGIAGCAVDGDEPSGFYVGRIRAWSGSRICAVVVNHNASF